MPSYTIRPATTKDAKTVADLHLRAFDEIYQALVPQEFFKPQNKTESLAYWRDAIEYGEPQVLVALEGDTIIGFVGFDRSRDERTKPTVGELWAMVVEPSYRGTGAGLALWDAAREGLLDEDCTQVTVWLPLGNERALRFHELAGFKRELPSARTVNVNGFRLEEIRLKRATA